MSQKISATHKYYFDVIRIFAILCVIYNHTNERGYYRYALTDTPPLKCFYYGLSAYIAVGVPLFFMISGALLLKKEESLKDLFSRRVLRMVLVLMVFSAIQYAYKLLTTDITFDPTHFIKVLLSDQIITPYWFLYSYLGFLLILPFLQKLASAMTDRMFVYLLMLQILMGGILPVIYSLLGMGTGHLKLPMLEHIIFYPLMGYYMENCLPKEQYHKKGVLIGLGGSLLSLAVIIAMSLQRNLPYEQFTPFDKGLYTCELTCVYTLTTFYCLRMLLEHCPPADGLKIILATVGGCIFGVYLTEEILRELTAPLYDILATVIGGFPACIVWVLLVFALGSCLTFLLKKVPGVRKLL